MQLAADVQIGDVVGFVPLAPNSCMVPTGDPSWHILLTHPNCEATAAAGLIGRGFRSYAPQIYKRVPYGRPDPATGKRKLIERSYPMFPRYIFADLREGQHDFSRATATAGIGGFLCIDGNRKVMPLKLLDKIRDGEAEELDIYQGKVGKRGKRETRFDVGQRVKITRGPFKDFLARIETLDDRGRVGVLMEIFARETPAWLEGYQIEAA